MELGALSLSALVKGLRSGQIPVAALVAHVRARHAAAAGAPGAYVAWDDAVLDRHAGALEALQRAGHAEGRLFGAPTSIKDLYGVPGYPTLAGTPRRLPAAFEAAGPVVQAVLRERGLVVGKTHTVEFAFGGIGANGHHGTPANPWDPARVPGGSSSGAGVSVAEGTAWLALGTDTAGSIRIPAAWTGVVGVKTTQGRWSTEGIVPLSSTLDTPGLMTRTAADARWAFAALDDEDAEPEAAPPAPPLLRLGVVEGLFDGADPGVAEAVQDALRKVAAAGARVEAVDVPEVREGLDLFMRGSVAGAELWAFLNRSLPGWIETLEPRVKQRVEAAEGMSAREYIDRRHLLSELARRAAARFAGYDALVAPTVVSTPPKLADLEALDAYAQANLRALRNTSVANTLGLCAVTVPVGVDAAGMPVGLMLMGSPRGEGRLLPVADAVERVVGWQVSLPG
ncbi:MAG: amidase [Deltaproteobacteria bacterium]|nr:amidase [Deltaproteobacteria bacterium]